MTGVQTCALPISLLASCAANGVLVPYVLLHNGLVVPIACLLYLGLTEFGVRVRVGDAADRHSRLDRHGLALARWLSKPSFQRFGGAAFALYLLHAVPMATLIVSRNWISGRPLLYGGRPVGSSIAELGLALLYCAISALVSVRIHERALVPFTRWLRDRVLRRTRPTRARATASTQDWPLPQEVI